MAGAPTVFGGWLGDLPGSDLAEGGLPGRQCGVDGRQLSSSMVPSSLTRMRLKNVWSSSRRSSGVLAR